jgi:phosphohistidine phosphatase
MSERTLILLRHAKSDWSGNEADVDRPLTARGLRQAPRAGRWLAHGIHRIDLAVVSPATRARSTWELASAELGSRPPTRIDDRVYAAPASQLLGVVRALPDDVDTVVLVGHNPGIEDLASLLAGEPVSMPTSALAVIGWDGSWSTAGQSPAIVRASGRPPADGPSGFGNRAGKRHRA